MSEPVCETICNPGRGRSLHSTWAFITGLFLLLLFIILPPGAAVEECNDAVTSPVVDFTYGVVPAESIPIMVNFYSTSEGGRTEKGRMTDRIESYHWNFGDGDTSDETSPMHTYFMSSARYQAAHKPYSVTLTVTSECGRTNTTTKNVSVYCLDQKAGFTIIQPEGDGPYPAPAAIYIKDTSLHVADHVTTYHYTLWNSGMTSLFKESTEKDPVFIIRNGGSYVIRQEVYKSCSSPPPENAEMKKTIAVTGSASTDAVPMETIPFTTIATEPQVTTAPVPETAVPVSGSPTTAPVPVVTMVPGTGTLTVVTNPDGAQVFVNEVLLGSSPATVPGLMPGSYNLRLEKSGFRTKTVPVLIGDGAVTEYKTTLDPESGGLGIVPIVLAVLLLAAGAGAVYRYRKKKKPVKVDWNNP